MRPAAVTDHWFAPHPDHETLHSDDRFSVVVDPALRASHRLTVLTTADGAVRVTVTPATADALGLRTRTPLTEASVRQAVADAGLAMHGADCLHHLGEPTRSALVAATTAPQPDGTASPRALTPTDAAAFTAFQASASEEDLDEAFVELDHWAVVGSFEGETLVAAASAYPWGETRLADVGVLTLDAARGRGHGRRTVQALCRAVLARGYEPQYRCQLDNTASRALAAAAGFVVLGTWDLVSPDDDEG